MLTAIVISTAALGVGSWAVASAQDDAPPVDDRPLQVNDPGWPEGVPAEHSSQLPKEVWSKTNPHGDHEHLDQHLFDCTTPEAAAEARARNANGPDPCALPGPPTTR